MDGLVTEENICKLRNNSKINGKSVFLFCWVDKILQEEIF